MIRGAGCTSGRKEGRGIDRNLLDVDKCCLGTGGSAQYSGQWDAAKAGTLIGRSGRG